MSDILKFIANICLVFLAIIGFGFCLAYGYYHYFVKDITIGINNIGDQTGLDILNNDSLSNQERNELEDRYFIEMNVYSNDKNNGSILYEMKFNFFDNYDLLSSSYRSAGMQITKDFEVKLTVKSSFNKKKLQDYINDYQDNGFYYYNSSNGIDYEGGNAQTPLNRAEKYIVSIDKEPYVISLQGTKEINYKYLGFIPSTVTYYYTFVDLFSDCIKLVKSNSRGYGDYYVKADLSSYFTEIRKYDTITGHFKQDDVTDIIKNYSVIKFHYDENGVRNSTQSIFGIIESNSKWDLEDSNIDSSYAQERILYTLTNKDLIYRYSDTFKGYFVSVGVNLKEIFSTMPKAKLTISIDLDYVDKKIVGIDYNGFENFKVDTLIVTGSPQTFYVLENGLNNTNLKTLKHSSDIVFDFANSVNSNYSEVIV